MKWGVVAALRHLIYTQGLLSGLKVKDKPDLQNIMSNRTSVKAENTLGIKLQR